MDFCPKRMLFPNLRALWLAAGMLVLAGCGGMSANECELADWQAVGYEDGARGRSTEVFGTYRKRCAKHDVAPDFQAYQAGRDAGLKEYCTPSRGYREGSRGAAYNGVCGDNGEGAFLEAYLDGKMLYDLESAVSSTQRGIDSRKARMNAIELELAEKMTAAVASDLPSDDRAALIIETKQLTEERITLAEEVKDLEVKLERQQEELDDYRAERVSQLN